MVLKFRLPPKAPPKIPATTAFIKKTKEQVQEEQNKLALAKMPKPAPVLHQRPISDRKGKRYYRVKAEWTVSKYRCTWVFPVGHEIEVMERSHGVSLVNFYPNTLTLKIADDVLNVHCEPM